MNENPIQDAPSPQEQLDQLSKSAHQIGESLRSSQPIRPSELAKKISELGDKLAKASQEIRKDAEEKGHLIALANIGQVINSSLNPDEVLKIVMDTIVRLTKASALR